MFFIAPNGFGKFNPVEIAYFHFDQNNILNAEVGKPFWRSIMVHKQQKLSNEF